MDGVQSTLGILQRNDGNLFLDSSSAKSLCTSGMWEAIGEN